MDQGSEEKRGDRREKGRTHRDPAFLAMRRGAKRG